MIASRPSLQETGHFDRLEPQSIGTRTGAERAFTGSIFLAAVVSFFLIGHVVELLQPYFFSPLRIEGKHMVEKLCLGALRPPAELLVMGSSRPVADINSSLLVRGMKLPSTKVLNLSIVASAADLNYLILRKHIFPHFTPQILIYGVSEFDIYGLLPGKSRYQSVNRLDFGHSQESLNEWPEYRDSSLKEKAAFILGQLNTLYKNRAILRASGTLLATRRDLWLPDLISRMIAIDDSVSKTDVLKPEEMEAMDVGYKKILPGYDTSKPFYDDLKKITKLAKQHNTRVILVNMPVSQRFRSYWQSDKKISDYRKALACFARQEEVTLIDLYTCENVIDEENDFWDSNHLNKHGSEALTNYLVRHLTKLSPEI